jgi:hypothetical protein
MSRADQRATADFWPFGLSDPLPTISIPLRPGDSDARLDLRAILDRVYDESAYEDYFYQRPPIRLYPPTTTHGLARFYSVP